MRVMPLLIFMALMVIHGCKPAVKEEIKTADCEIQNLKVIVNSEKAEISWQPKCNALLTGYNIYIKDYSMTETFGNDWPDTIAPFNFSVYPGDTEADDIENYTAELLRDGQLYYVRVRAVLADGSLGKPSEEAAFVCGPRGEITLAQRFKSEQDGFSFAANNYTRADDVNNDLFFFVAEGGDYLASPLRLGGFLRQSKFMILPFRGDLTGISVQTEALSDAPAADKVEIRKGNWVWMKTAEGYDVLLKVVDFGGAGDNRSIRLFYAFTSADGLFF